MIAKERARCLGIALLALAAAAWALHLASPTPARASSTELSMMMDDEQLIYVDSPHADQTLQAMKGLGVDVVKVSLVWQLVAPDPFSSERPSFNATDPAAYPAGAWDRYDNIVNVAHSLGMKVYFLVIGPSPQWAIPSDTVQGQGPSLGNAPNPAEYQQFVEAAGTRYSGNYVPAGSTGGQALPRVSYWGIWNEPNEQSWLNPWHRSLPDHRTEFLQPPLYRGLVDAAWNGLTASGHASDTVMIGETANVGALAPTPFIRGLYCVGANLRPLRGAAAEQYGCPTSGDQAAFTREHPGLFESDGFAHHPYASTAPNRPSPSHTFITLYNVSSLEQMLNGIFATYGRRPKGGVTVYLTEWGYKTNPPNPYAHTSLAQQAAWLNEGEYMTWGDPFVRGVTQFLLVDSPPMQGQERGSALYWSSYQTGLEDANGNPKPAFDAFRIPIWVPAAHHGRRVTVWGQLRAADHGGPQAGEIQFERRGSSTWSNLAAVRTGNPEGFLTAHVSMPSAGFVRLAWTDPSGNVDYSRVVAVR